MSQKTEKEVDIGGIHLPTDLWECRWLEMLQIIPREAVRLTPPIEI